jgi:type I restriction enzyme S subunit
VKEGFAELGSVAEFINGAAFKPEDWGNEGKRIIRIQNLTDTTKPFNRTNREVAKKLHVNPGDLLVSWSATLGVFEWNEPEVALLNQHIFRVVPNEVRVEKRYLRHGLEGALLEMQRHLHGATMQHVNRGEFLATKLYLPPLAEQRRIAEVLDKAEALRAKRRAALAQLDSLTQSLFLDLFGDPGSATQKFPVQRLGEVALKITDGEHQTPKRTTEGIKLLSARNIRDGFIDTKDVDHVGQQEYERIRRRCDPQVGDILISCSGTIGRVAIVKLTEPLSLVRSVALVKPDRRIHEPEFMEHYLRTPAMKARMIRSAHSSSQANLFQGPIRELDIFIPPLDLQREFARRVAAVEKLKTAQCAALTELDALFASLQHRAFRGELLDI